MTDVKSTKDVIKAMLTENTGRSFLDSGDYYGRNYERNQKRDFESEPACIVEADEKYQSVSISFNLYHYLTSYLEYDDELQSEFEAYCKRVDPNEDKGYTELMEDFARQWTHVSSENSYNHDNLLSQDIFYVMFSKTDNEYDCHVLLQVHGGCDIRGGYTAPKAFRVLERDYFWLAETDVSASAIDSQGNRHYWQSDDAGYRWYYEGSSKNEIPLVFKVIDGKVFTEVQVPVKEDPTTMLFDKTKLGEAPTVTETVPVEFMVSKDW